eukprot:Pgem_evm2s19682
MLATAIFMIIPLLVTIIIGNFIKKESAKGKEESKKANKEKEQKEKEQKEKEQKEKEQKEKEQKEKEQKEKEKEQKEKEQKEKEQKEWAHKEKVQKEREKKEREQKEREQKIKEKEDIIQKERERRVEEQKECFIEVAKHVEKLNSAGKSRDEFLKLILNEYPTLKYKSTHDKLKAQFNEEKFVIDNHFIKNKQRTESEKWKKLSTVICKWLVSYKANM